jgi:hypothetical protein
MLRMLVLTLLVVLVVSLIIAPPPAEGCGLDEAYWFAQYLCETFSWCD